MEAVVRVGIVGYGFATSVFHAPLITHVPGLELVAISTSDPQKVRADLPGVQVCATPEILFAKNDIDLVVVPTPNETHYPLAAAALAAGKHVVVDKPFTLDVAQAQDLILQAKKAGKVLSVFQNRRWDSDFLTLKQVLESGTLGRIAHFESHFDRYRPEVKDRWRETASRGGGLWYDLGPHLLDQTLQLFGLPESITLDLARQREGSLKDDWFHAILPYGDMRVILHGSTMVPRVGPRLIVHGTEGSFVKYGLDAQEDALRAGLRPGAGWGKDPQPGTLFTPVEATVSERTVSGISGDYTSYYKALRDAILGKGPNPVPAEEGLLVMRLIEAGRTSSQEKRTVALSLEA